MTNLSTTLTYKLRKGEGRKWNNGRDSCHLCTWHGFFFCLDYDLPVLSFLLPEWGGWANHQRDWKFLYCWFYLNNLFSDLIVLWRNRSIYSKTCLFTMDGVWLVGLNSQLGAAHYIIADGEGRVSSNDLQRGCPNSFITRKQNSGPPPCEGALPLQRGTWCLKIITSSYQGMPYFLRYCFRTPTSLNDKSFLCQKDSLHFFFWADFFWKIFYFLWCRSWPTSIHVSETASQLSTWTLVVKRVCLQHKDWYCCHRRYIVNPSPW